ncbi:MAG: energy-coupling factor transporter transmembrane protein EcfT [Clostridia bacterium]|nr:energy-coupling factor transporter transmembrane protein EcfT [Clostridia bacterium]MBQ4610384.1 energy-coupling factor transporter transmembrane protein EcfT [Clostridia bacterium]
MTNLFNYIPRSSVVHRLTGATKLAALLLLTFASMTSFDTRLLGGMVIFAFAMFGVSKIKLKEVAPVLWFTFVFMILNNLLIYAFSPEEGVAIYGSRTEICHLFGRYYLTKEQLFYQLNVVLKYLVMIPLVLLFVSTTNPSEFAASLNRIGVSYKIAFSVALAMRYIPDVQREYHDISLSLQARGVEMTSKEKLLKRIKNVATILFPLIMTSMQKIEVISNAMELRSFGKEKKRTWYAARPFRAADYIVMGGSALVVLLSLGLTFLNGGRFYNPFV